MNSYAYFFDITLCCSVFFYGSNMLLNMWTSLYLMILVLCWICYCLSEFMVIVFYVFLIMHKAFQSNLVWYWTNIHFSVIYILCAYVSIFSTSNVLTPISPFFPIILGSSHWWIRDQFARKSWIILHSMGYVLKIRGWILFLILPMWLAII